MNNENAHNSIDTLILFNDLQQFASPSSTSVGISVPSSEDLQNRTITNLANKVGSIGPQQDPSISEQELMEIIMSLTPMGSVRGGKPAKSTLEQLLGLKPPLSKKHGVKSPVQNLGRQGLHKPNPRTPKDIEFLNKLSSSRINKQKVLNKYGIADPDKQGMVDPVSALLNYFSKN